MYHIILNVLNDNESWNYVCLFVIHESKFPNFFICRIDNIVHSTLCLHTISFIIVICFDYNNMNIDSILMFIFHVLCIIVMCVWNNSEQTNSTKN